MGKYTIHQAKSNLSKLLVRAQSGEEVTILNRDRPVAKLVPIAPKHRSSLIGDLRNKIKIRKEFEKIPEGFEDYT